MRHFKPVCGPLKHSVALTRGPSSSAFALAGSASLAARASLCIMTDDRGDPFGDKGVGPFADFRSPELWITGYAVLEAFKLRAVEPIAPDCTTEIRQGIAVDRRSLRKTRMEGPGLGHTHQMTRLRQPAPPLPVPPGPFRSARPPTPPIL